MTLLSVQEEHVVPGGFGGESIGLVKCPFARAGNQSSRFTWQICLAPNAHDAMEYASRYGDLAEAFGEDTNGLTDHWYRYQEGEQRVFGREEGLFGSRQLNNGDRVMLRSASGYLSSNFGEGQQFTQIARVPPPHMRDYPEEASWQDRQDDISWEIVSDGPVVSGSTIHLRSVSGQQNGMCIYSNGGAADPISFGEEPEQGWNVMLAAVPTHEAEASIAQANQRGEALQADIDGRLADIVNALQAEVAAQTERADAAEATAAANGRDMEDLQQQVDAAAAAGDPEVLERQVAVLEADKAQLEDTISLRDEKIEEMDGQIAALGEDNNTEELEAECAESNRKLDETRAALAEAEAKVESYAELAERLEELDGFKADAEKVPALESKVEALKNIIARMDANNIHQACKGMGTDDKRLIGILGSRSNAMMQIIDAQYQVKYDKSLAEQIKSECSGQYGEFLVRIVTPMVVNKSRLIHEACAGFGTNETDLVEDFCILTNEEIAAIREYYPQLEENESCAGLLEVLDSELGGSLKDLVLALARGERSESEDADEELAEELADRLYKAGEGKTFGKDSKSFCDILVGNSVAQLAAVSVAYENKHNKNLARAIAKTFSGNMEAALLLLLDSPATAKAKLLNKAFGGLGCDDDLVARVLGGSSMAQACEIALTYGALYDEALGDRITSELSGNLKMVAKMWIGDMDAAVRDAAHDA